MHGMTCDSCADTVRRGLSRLDGVTHVEVDAGDARAVVTGDVDDATVRERVLRMGYDLTPVTTRAWSTGQMTAVVGLVVAVLAAGTWIFTRVAEAVTGPSGAAGVESTFAAVSPAAFGLAFVLGLAAAFAPSSLAMAPVVMGTVLEGRAHSTGHAARQAAAFVSGVLVVDAVVGAVFAAGGAAAIAWLEARLAVWFLLMFLVLTLLAIVALDVWRPRLPGAVRDLPRPDTPGAAFAAGVPFGLLACPSCTPMLLPVILGAVATGDPVYGAAVLATFGLGRGLPLVVVGASTGRHALPATCDASCP